MNSDLEEKMKLSVISAHSAYNWIDGEEYKDDDDLDQIALRILDMGNNADFENSRKNTFLDPDFNLQAPVLKILNTATDILEKIVPNQSVTIKNKKEKVDEILDREIEEDMENIDKSKSILDSKFRIQNHALLLTYRTHIDKLKIKIFFENICLAKKNQPVPVEFYICHEKSSSKTDYAHSHVFVNFGQEFNTKNCRLFDYEEIHPNIQPITSKTYDYVYRYISKEDKSPDLLFLSLKYKKSCIERLHECKTIDEAMKLHCKKPSDALGIKLLYEMKVKKAMVIEDPRKELHKKWQHPLWMWLLAEDYDLRSITWICDMEGSGGKTRFTDVFQSNYQDDVRKVTIFGGSSNAATVMQSEIESGWTGKYLFVDFSRATVDHQIYGPLEDIANGKMTVLKYKGCTLSLPQRPRIIVFANWYPIMKEMSIDRWNVGNIYNGYLYFYNNIKREERLKRDMAEKNLVNNLDWSKNGISDVSLIGNLELNQLVQDLTNLEGNELYPGSITNMKCVNGTKALQVSPLRRDVASIEAPADNINSRRLSSQKSTLEILAQPRKNCRSNLEKFESKK